ncbi:AAA family ATPase [Lysobacter auxotrophicus]|uniref:AAA family ATPase n=1 Tax=Lysobacter auxotrophicus TaxID=2992573 RepID=A0ABM8DER7_9GAMM|nr:AAA family ATPase [Lysobacter auxotrophicus]BDU17096.1 AAA family ATPase [Lysobacter auxotrophicus]
MLQVVGLHGFKSFYGTKSVSFGSLTILAGANSSGKSSLMQPLLLMKQTLECPFDPGPLLLEGPNVRITSADQVLARQRTAGEDRVGVVVGLRGAPMYSALFKKAPRGFALFEQTLGNPRRPNDKGVALKEGVSLSVKSDEIQALSKLNNMVRAWSQISRTKKPTFGTVRDRCFIGLSVDIEGGDASNKPNVDIDIASFVAEALKSLIHIPGLRGNPERTYKTTAVGSSFPGTFDNYVASVIQSWQAKGAVELRQLNQNLAQVGLNPGVSATEELDTRVAIEVSRVAGVSAIDDRVSIADVGLGVSQVLPFLVALLVARPGQIVYVEQPELHLHPASQYRLAEVIQHAIVRGVQVIMETHSAILIRGVQTLVAQGRIESDQVVLNWFSRNEGGATRVDSKTLDKDGSVGSWPADFDEVSLAADTAYLDAVAEVHGQSLSEEQL